MAKRSRECSQTRSATLFFYTSNPGKVREVKGLLGPLGIRVEWRKATLPEPQADRLEEVVMSKLAAVPATVRMAMVEDSGLFVKELRGFPGVYSSYVMKTLGAGGLIPLLNGKGRSAEFKAVIGFREGGRITLFTGVTEGHISTVEKGNLGFGFDPVFIPSGETRTMSQMGLEEKNRLSHRGKALRKLVEHLERRCSGAH
jgi:XTP/dITP diphosphohydrolase